MVKKALIVLIVALFCVLLGLVVVFFYLQQPSHKKNSVLLFIAPQTELVVRIKETSVTTNNFMADEVVADCFKLGSLRIYWQTIDSITSRNYKTSEVLNKNTSYICVDSTGNYLILIDLDKKTNEQFIDQFLVSSTQSKKIEKFKEGYKAFYPSENEPLYYFVKQNVFGISPNQEYIRQAIQTGVAGKIEGNLLDWENNSRSSISVWGRRGAEKGTLNQFTTEFLFGGWLDKLAEVFWFDVVADANGINLKGELNYDSLNTEIRKFAIGFDDFNYPMVETDSGQYQNYYFNLLMPDTIGGLQPTNFVYSQFTDSSKQETFLLVSTSAVAIGNFRNAMDTSVQIIQMAHDQIEQIAVMNYLTCKKIAPFIPFMGDTAKWFGLVYHDQLFISNSTESIINYVPNYPDKIFKKIKLGRKDLIFSSNQMLFNHLYQIQYKYQWGKDNQINFSSFIKRRKR